MLASASVWRELRLFTTFLKTVSFPARRHHRRVAVVEWLAANAHAAAACLRESTSRALRESTCSV